MTNGKHQTWDPQMYNQLIYFIIVLLLFTTQQPGTELPQPAAQMFFLTTGLYLLYALICYLAFRPLKSAERQGLPDSILSLQYHRAQNRLSILALGFVAIHIYALDLKLYLQQIPGFEESLTLTGMAGLAFYLLHLCAIWFFSYPIYERLHQTTMGRGAYLREHFAFSSAVLIPWFLISFVADLLQLFTMPRFLNTDLGQFLILGVVLIFFVLFSPGLVVRLWGCRSLPDTPVRRELEEFCERFKFRVGNFLLWPLFGGEMLTAGVIGILPRWRYILITRGLLGVLDMEELKAVVAHEMGHVRRLHLPLYMTFFIFFSVLTYSFHDILLMLLLQSRTLFQWAVSSQGYHLTLFSLVYMIPILILLIVYFRYVFGFFLRNSERQADLYALQLIGHPLTLVSSLRKIALYSGRIEDLPSWHHFSIRQRIAFLLDSYRNPDLIRRHHMKLYSSALIFLLTAGSLSSLGFYLERSKMLESWRMDLQVRILEREFSRNAQDVEISAAYGGLLMEQGRYREAESVLQKAQQRAPNNATVLNNLAWFYATSPPPHFRPGLALELATRAAGKQQDVHILDTLAEAYYVNGRYEEALATIQKALLKEPENRDYYLRQKTKFEEALRRSRAGERDELLEEGRKRAATAPFRPQALIADSGHSAGVRLH